MAMVIVGEFDSDNVGDQLIGEGHAATFSAHGSAVRILALEPARNHAGERARQPGRLDPARRLHRLFYQRSAMYRHIVESANHVRRRRAYRLHAETTLSGADGLIIGGGQLLSDGTLRMLHRLDHLTEVAQRRGIPVVAFGTGMSPGRTFLSRYLLRRVLGRLSERNYFRDKASMTAARAACPAIRLSAEPTPDCAIAGIVPRKLLDVDAEVVGIAPMSPMILARLGVPLDKIDDWWLDIIRHIVREGGKPALFCTGVSVDMQYAAALQSKLAESGLKIELLPRPMCSEDLLNALRQMKRLLAQRLHASISFYSLGGIPASASWDSKVGEFYDSISLPGRVFRVGEGLPADIARAVMAPAGAGVDRLSLAKQSHADAQRCVKRMAASRVGKYVAR